MFEVAFHLKMPVYLLSEMPYEELLKWIVYFELKPPGWQADDRAYKMMQTQGVKKKPWEVFKSLEKVYRGNIKENGPMSSFKDSSVFNMIMGAVGGEKLPV